jgi:aminoglycoside phosphotransferase (APT) family kinase protein
MTAATPSPPEPALLAALRRMGLAHDGEALTLTPLTGGVSSDIVRVDAGTGRYCLKRALPKLKVAADWQAPVERNACEVEWMRAAAGIVADAVPRVLGEDRAAGCFAMEYLDPDSHPVWKRLLLSGEVSGATAAAVGNVLGRIHAATADRPEVAAKFRTDAIFHAIRLEPYLLATGVAHPELAARLGALAARTASTRRVLVHGDFSPKNILIGTRGPVILDAECAWFGDPAFDVAFVLKHLLLKGAWQPQWRSRYLDAYAALWAAYRAHVAWEPVDALEARAASLLPALLLARIDGKSPVEYLTTDQQRAPVRRFASERVRVAPSRLTDIARDWQAQEVG